MKANCYDCKFRRNVPGDTHSSCAHPTTGTNGGDMFDGIVAMLSGGVVNKIGVRGNSHGINNGWFMWPFNFDPAWLENCEGFEE